AAPPPLKRVLIPRGRSLQRDAARPDYFKFPRAVMGVDGEPAPEHAALLLKDRLYLGYQEKANVLEVLSYNEAAGRFEFQLVRDYREGGARNVVYANRTLCTACHQNAAPIFSRPLWDETNANPAIAALLGAEQRQFYGFPVEQGIDIPYGIDVSKERANQLAMYQYLWRDGCGAGAEGIACRADLLRLALLYRLNGSQRVGALPDGLAERWRQKWPHGLFVPNPELPNRNPLLKAIVGS